MSQAQTLSQTETLKKNFDEIAPKLKEMVEKLKQQAVKNQDWANVRIYNGSNIQLIVSASPTGVVMLRICTRKVTNCIRIVRPEALEELMLALGTFGTSKASEVVEEILRENPTRGGGIVDLSVF